jgi:hypothetical protein
MPFLAVLGWLCIGLGAVLCLPPLRALTLRRSRVSARRHPTADVGTPWLEVRMGLTAVAVGVMLVGLHSRGVAAWLTGIPVIVMATLNLLLWITARLRRRSRAAVPEPLRYGTATFRPRHAAPTDRRRR